MAHSVRVPLLDEQWSPEHGSVRIGGSRTMGAAAGGEFNPSSGIQVVEYVPANPALALGALIGSHLSLQERSAKRSFECHLKPPQSQLDVERLVVAFTASSRRAASVPTATPTASRRT